MLHDATGIDFAQKFLKRWNKTNKVYRLTPSRPILCRLEAQHFCHVFPSFYHVIPTEHFWWLLILPVYYNHLWSSFELKCPKNIFLFQRKKVTVCHSPSKQERSKSFWFLITHTKLFCLSSAIAQLVPRSLIKCLLCHARKVLFLFSQSSSCFQMLHKRQTSSLLRLFMVRITLNKIKRNQALMTVFGTLKNVAQMVLGLARYGWNNINNSWVVSLCCCLVVHLFYDNWFDGWSSWLKTQPWKDACRNYGTRFSFDLQSTWSTGSMPHKVNDNENGTKTPSSSPRHFDRDNCMIWAVFYVHAF